MAKVKIYIASPYTIGDKLENVARSIATANALMQLGFVPFWPLHSHYHDELYSHPWHTWMEIDKEWVSVCDGVLRLKGESKGADIEVAYAKELGKPVFTELWEVMDFFGIGEVE